MWGFPRSESRPEPRPVVRHGDTLEGFTELASGWFARMRDLVHARRLAYPSKIAAIDEEMDQLCREVADEVEKTGKGELTKRIRRMKHLALEEIVEQRDKARGNG